MKNNYDDIINLPHHQSEFHPHMSIQDRAAQFSPFAALTGHDDAINETARLTSDKIELNEDRENILNRKIMLINKNVDLVSITYFLPDEKKDGGKYVTVTDYIKKFNIDEKLIVLKNGTKIPFSDVMDIDSELLGNIEYE